MIQADWHLSFADSSDSSNQPVVTVDGQAGSSTDSTLLQRWILANVGLAAQRQLMAAQPQIQALGNPTVYVNPLELSNPGGRGARHLVWGRCIALHGAE